MKTNKDLKEKVESNYIDQLREIKQNCVDGWITYNEARLLKRDLVTEGKERRLTAKTKRVLVGLSASLLSLEFLVLDNGFLLQGVDLIENVISGGSRNIVTQLISTAIIGSAAMYVINYRAPKVVQHVVNGLIPELPNYEVVCKVADNNREVVKGNKLVEQDTVNEGYTLDSKKLGYRQHSD